VSFNLYDADDALANGDGVSSFFGGNGNGPRPSTGNMLVGPMHRTPRAQHMRGKGAVRGNFAISPVWLIAGAIGLYLLLRR